MTHEPLYFVRSSVRNSRTPYSLDRLQPVMTVEAEDWPRGWGTQEMGYRTIRSRVTPAKEQLTIEAVLSWIGRMVVPVLALGLTMMVAFLFGGAANFALDGFAGSEATGYPSAWLTDSHFLICLSFLMIALTNRAFGAGFTVAQIVITWAVLGGVVFWFQEEITTMFSTGPIPAFGSVMTFVIALAVGQLVSVIAFDLTRGPRWWTAPLWGPMVGSAVFVGLYYALNTGLANWSDRFALDMVVKVLMVLIMLAPYYMLRGSIRPQPGYGGA